MKTSYIFLIVFLFSNLSIAQTSSPSTRERTNVSGAWRVAADSETAEPPTGGGPYGNPGGNGRYGYPGGGIGMALNQLTEQEEKDLKDLVSKSRCNWSYGSGPSTLKIEACKSSDSEAGIICMGSVNCVDLKNGFGVIDFPMVYCGVKKGRCPMPNDCILDFKIDNFIGKDKIASGNGTYIQGTKPESDYKDLKKGETRESAQ